MKVSHREQCPKCAKKGNDTREDNLVVYADGGAYCFACGYTRKGKSVKIMPLESKTITLPKHFVKARSLGYKYNIPTHVLEQCAVYESPLLDKDNDAVDVEGQYAFTYYDEKLRLVGIKYRDFYNEYNNDTKKDENIYVEGRITLGGLVTCSRLKPGKVKNTVCIWEGETDWLKAIASDVKHKHDHLFIPGNRSVKYVKDYSLLLRKYHTIYIGFDNDAAGLEARERVKEYLPLHKLRFVDYGKHNDLIDYINAGCNFDTLITSAYSEEENDLLCGDDLLQHCLNYFDTIDAADYIDTGIDCINDMLGGGLTPSEVLVLAGHTGIGKSSLCTTLAYNISDSVKSLWIGSEMQPAQNVRKFVEIASGKRYYRNKLTGQWSIDSKTRNEIIAELSKDIIFYRKLVSDWEKVEEAILAAIYQHDVGCVFIDVLSDFLSTDWQQNEYIMKQLNWIAAGDEEDGRPPIPIVCVAHTRDIVGVSKKKVTVNHIVGGKCVRQKATCIISIEGEIDSMDTSRELRVIKKSRMNESSKVVGKVYFDTEDRCYRDAEDVSDNVIALPKRS